MIYKWYMYNNNDPTLFPDSLFVAVAVDAFLWYRESHCAQTSQRVLGPEILGPKPPAFTLKKNGWSSCENEFALVDVVFDCEV
jgi:hypothetical protein